MERIVFTGRRGPERKDDESSFQFEYDYISDSTIEKKHVEVAISSTIISLYNVDVANGEIFFNCLLKEIYRNGIENIERNNAKIKISIEENQHLYDPEHVTKFTPQYEIDL